MAVGDFRKGAALLGRLKSRQLLLLLALEDTRSVRKAAASVNMTQPTASKLLQDLEASVGTKLFDRGRRGVQATIFGEVMIRHARFVLADLDRTRLELSALASGATGRVRIGAVISAVPFLLARAVARLKADRPGLQVSIEVGTSDALVPSLADGELDVLLARPLVLRERPEFDYEDLIDEPLHVVARMGHPLAGVRGLSLPDLAGRPWALLPAGSPMRKVLVPVFAEIGLREPMDVVETSSMMTMAALLEESDMMAVMPADVASFYTGRGLLVRLQVMLPPVMGSYGIVTRRDRPLPPSVAAFIAGLKICRDHRLTESDGVS